MTRCKRRRGSGFAYFSVLWLVAFLAVGLLVMAEVYATSERRAREEELLLIGREFSQAIRRYAEESSKLGQTSKYPAALADLVEDRRRSGAPQRHLRRIYPDPITKNIEWGLVRVNGGIAGIHSLSTRRPLKVGAFGSDEQHLDGRGQYSEWIFGDQAALVTGPGRSVEMKK